MMLARPLRLLCLFFLFVILPLGLRPLWIPDEARYAEIAREMLASGNWVVPQLLGMHYFEKPVGGYWFNALSQAAFGPSLFAARLPVALATAASTLMVGMLAHRLWRDTRKTAIAMLVYSSFALVSGLALYITLDSQLACWLNLALLSFHVAITAAAPRHRLAAWVVLGAACGMAFLTKGFVGWVVPLLVVCGYMAWQRRWAQLLPYGGLAALVAVAVAAPWALAVQRQAPDFWNFFFWNEHVRRLAASDAQHGRPFWFYLPVLILGCLPWLGLLPGAARRAWAERRHPAVGLLLLWLLLPLAFFSLARGKLPTYILPCFTPLALLLVPALADSPGPGADRGRKANAAINGLVGVTALLALLLARRMEIFDANDRAAWLCAMAVGMAWLLVALVQWRRPGPSWELSALPMWLLWASAAWLLPQDQIDSKQPSMFIQSHRQTLDEAEFLLANDAGLAANLAWELARTGITAYGQLGELQYGLSTAAGARRFVSRQEVATWIAAARRQGDVAVVLRVRGPGDPDLTALPPGASKQDLRARLALVFYSRLPPA